MVTGGCSCRLGRLPSAALLKSTVAFPFPKTFPFWPQANTVPSLDYSDPEMS